MKSVFILPSKFGWMFITLCLGLFILGTNYQNNVMLLLCYLLVSIFLLNLYATYWNFSRLDMSLHVKPIVTAGQEIPITLTTYLDDNEKSTQGTLYLRAYGTKENVRFYPSQSSKHCLTLVPQKRGVYPLPRFTVEGFFPFGLYRCWTHIDFDLKVIVIPESIEASIVLHAQHADEHEEGVTQSHAGSEDFAGLKPYISGDNLNRVAWKHVAKQQQWVSKSFESTYTQEGWLRLPLTEAEQVEFALSKLAYQINVCAQQNNRFGVDLGHSKIEPDQGETHRITCLTALAYYPNQPTSNA